jgi:adenine phosphoribosyltransferase
MSWIQARIRDVPGFPHDGFVFRDITPLLVEPGLLTQVVEAMAAPWREVRIDKIVGIESRGWLFAAPMAAVLRCGLVLARKFGSLPRRSVKEPYDELHSIEIHDDALHAGERVLIVDDLLATGVTSAATRRIVERLHGEIIGYQFLVELQTYEGARRLSPAPVNALVRYQS